MEIFKKSNVCSSTNFNHLWNTSCSEKGLPISLPVMLENIQTSNQTQKVGVNARNVQS